MKIYSSHFVASATTICIFLLITGITNLFTSTNPDTCQAAALLVPSIPTLSVVQVTRTNINNNRWRITCRWNHARHHVVFSLSLSQIRRIHTGTKNINIHRSNQSIVLTNRWELYQTMSWKQLGSTPMSTSTKVIVTYKQVVPQPVFSPTFEVKV